MTSRKHLAFLYEMFLPEARFPDEKFWNRDGTPIYPDPKGPPPGTAGSTHADIGATGPAVKGGRTSKTFGEYELKVFKDAFKAFGDDFADFNGKKAKDIVKQAWNEGANEQEAVERLGDAISKEKGTQFSDDPYYSPKPKKKPGRPSVQGAISRVLGKV